ncbi:PQQ-dependent sugar dehydrogenase [Vulgatibacter incomptus]|nr:PQQ-dependent sugar dehydrogenase [Vulgatibacter incomptus]
MVDADYGPDGTVPVRAETVVSGLTVPWAIAFLPDGAMLVTERIGRLRLVEKGELVEKPVMTVPYPTGGFGEGGLLGLALHPDFAKNRLFYVYYSFAKAGGIRNRVERFRLSEDHRSATTDRVILDDLPGHPFHDSGRIHVGPDKMLYVGVGDSGEPKLAQDPNARNGKLLRINLDGGIPDDNPVRGNPLFLLGVRNTEGFDWLDPKTLIIADHGPSGDLGRTGLDEVNIARKGDNLGWPTISGCAVEKGMVTPVLSWKLAVPPGGLVIDRSGAIPQWKGSVIMGTLGSRHLHRVVLDSKHRVEKHEVYFRGDPPQGLGRLREVIVGPDNQLYVTTSNCDGRGTCPPDRDKILRIVPK